MLQYHFWCGSSRAIQRILFQVATTNSFRVMMENTVFFRKWLSKKHKIANISKTEYRTKKVWATFLWEESNGLCFRSIRPIVFELWPKMSIWPLTCGKLLDRKRNSKTRHMGRKPFAICTFWFLFGVIRSSSFRDMTDQSSLPFDLWWPWPLTLTSQNR